MPIRRVQNWVWWLLPLMVARAMLPVGFMPAVGTHGLQVVLCSAALSAQDAHRLHPAGGGHHEPDSAAQHGGLTCPFAHAAVGAPPSFAPIVGAILQKSAPVLLSGAQRFVSFGPPRLDRVRGPPALS